MLLVSKGLRRSLPVLRATKRHYARPTVVKVDTRGLLRTEPIEESKLTAEIRMLIKELGPMTVADFMQQALQHPEHGYYTSQDSQIGLSGDFTTAPEISQLFGESIGIWCVSMWESLGKPEKFHLVEMGPGKGTLMKDILRTARNFPQFRSAATVHLVETSRELRQKQRSMLGAVSLTNEKNRNQQQQQLIGDSKRSSGSNVSESKDEVAHNDGNTKITEVLGVEELKIEDEEMVMQLPDGGSIHWHTLFMDVPDDGLPLIYIGQEILDALPIHQFEYTEKGWRELLVANLPKGSIPPFQIITSKFPTPAVGAYLTKGRGSRGLKFDTDPNLNTDQDAMSSAYDRDMSWRLQEAEVLEMEQPALILESGHQLSHARFNDEDEYKKKKEQYEAKLKELELTSSVGSGLGLGLDSSGAMVGDRIEVCPASLALTQNIADRIAVKKSNDGKSKKSGGGAAIFIDYGADHALPNSLRGFHKHSESHILARPGEVDLTADVNFAAIRSLLERAPGVKPYGPVPQGSFLAHMGAPQRLMALIDKEETTEEMAESLVNSYERLIDPEQMGERYKVLVFTDDEQATIPAGGFGENEIFTYVKDDGNDDDDEGDVLKK